MKTLTSYYKEIQFYADSYLNAPARFRATGIDTAENRAIAESNVALIQQVNLRLLKKIHRRL